MPAVALTLGAALWGFGARVARPAVTLLGFAAGVPAGVMLRDALGLESVPQVAAAVIGAFAGLILARLAFRLVLVASVGLSLALLAAVLSASLVDRGVLSKPGMESAQAAKARAQQLAEAVASEIQATEDGAPPFDRLRAAVRRFWETLEKPERTLVLAASLAAGVAGLAFALFLRSMAETGFTSIVGAMAVSWALSQMIGADGPSPAAWCLATAVLSVVGMFVQTMTRRRADGSKPASEAAATAA